MRGTRFQNGPLEPDDAIACQRQEKQLIRLALFHRFRGQSLICGEDDLYLLVLYLSQLRHDLFKRVLSVDSWVKMRNVEFQPAVDVIELGEIVRQQRLKAIEGNSAILAFELRRKLLDRALLLAISVFRRIVFRLEGHEEDTLWNSRRRCGVRIGLVHPAGQLPSQGGLFLWWLRRSRCPSRARASA